jgi:IMP dehydrogenase
MLGQTLAGTLSSPSLIINRNGKKCKYFRGMASTIAHLENQHAKGKEEIEENFNAEGIDGFVEIKGTVHDVIHQINGDIKSCFSYIGCNNICDVHKKRASNEITFSIVTSIGMSETGTRIKTN